MKDDAAFVADFKASHQWVVLVGDWLRRLGYEVRIPDQNLRPTAALRHLYSDDGDLFVTTKGITKAVEVKHRSIDFTSAFDYPFPTIIVNEAHLLTDERLAKIFGYVIVNDPGTHVAVVRPHTRPFWIASPPTWIAAQQRWETFLACPLYFASYYRLTTDPRG
jgi:hypothetical protein